MSRLDAELRRVFGDPPVAPRAVVRVQVGGGQDLASGRAEADRLVDAGADLVVLDAGPPQAGALVALALLLDLEPTAGGGATTAVGWKELVVAVRSGVRAARPLAHDPEQLVAALDDPALARTTGLLAGLGNRRTPVLCGGAATTAAAALLAERLVPGACAWWLAGANPTLSAAAQAWRTLGRTPLLDLGLEETGADVAVAVVRTGLELLGA